MKKILTILTISAGLLVACDSNKGNRSSEKATAMPTTYSKPQPEKATVAAQPQGPKTRLDSLLDQSGWDNSSGGTSRRPRTNFQGASGAGTGGTYAAGAYGKESYKKKPVKAAVKADTTRINNNSVITDSTSIQPTW